jgi:hypothetical protein
MTQAIWKYQVNANRTTEHSMPVGARILCAQRQPTPDTVGERIQLWARVEPGNPSEVREFIVLPTGYEGDIVGDYISTVQIHGGRGVYHVFEITKGKI